MTVTDPAAAEFQRLTQAFFRAVSFEAGGRPPYETIRELFIERGLLVKNVGPQPEISSIDEFIAPRQALVDAGRLTRFHEAELWARTVVFGNVGHRWSAYEKSGTQDGKSFEAQGMITTQFVRTPAGWRMSAMAWDDARPGLAMPDAPEKIA